MQGMGGTVGEGEEKTREGGAAGKELQRRGRTTVGSGERTAAARRARDRDRVSRPAVLFGQFGYNRN